MTNQNNTKVVTGVVRLSYANVWEPKSINGGAEKYSVSLIIPKSDKKTISQIETAIDNAIKEGASKFGGKIPNKAAIKLPLRDGDIERDDEAYQDSYFVNANSKQPRRLLMQRFSLFLTATKFIAVCMQECPLPSMHSTLTAIRVLPVVLAIFKK